MPIQWKASYVWIAVAVVALAVVAAYVVPGWLAVVNPPLNSALSASGNDHAGDWHTDTAHEFLFGTDMSGNTTAPNHCPDSWTRTHMHVGKKNTNHFYFDASKTTPGHDTDATDGIDRAMLFFYAGHGLPDSFDTLGNSATQGSMLIGDDGLRYYWQCSCQVFSHGPSSCTSSAMAYGCPGAFTGGSDSSSMRNVYERWGPALGSNLRMACGVSTLAWCHEGNVDRIWDNYNNNGLDVSDSFIQGLSGGTLAVPLCITTGGFTTALTPLYDSEFTNQANPSGDYYHIQYLGGFATTAPEAFVPEVPELLPKYALIPIPLPDPWRKYKLFERGELLISEELAGERGPRWLVNPRSGAMYARGLRVLDAGDAALSEEEYLEAASKLIDELGWTEELHAQLQGNSMWLETRPRKAGEAEVERSQKNVTVTIRRRLEIEGREVPVFGTGGLITIQLNNDGSLLNAAKVWRSIGEVKAMLPTKPYDQAEEEARATLGRAAERYRLDNWTWGYKEEAGNVEQTEMVMYYRFDFRPLTDEDLRQHPPRMVEIPGLVE